MFTARNKGRLAITAVAVGAALALTGCASGDPLDSGSGGSDSDSDTIVVGSQAYYSNEIIAEIYAQALENAGYTVDRQFQIGQRDAYLPALEDGEVDLIPEYTGNLLQFYDDTATATQSDEVYAALQDALPDGLAVLDQSPATDQDSYNVTAAFAEANSLTSIADLANVPDLILGGNAELEERPYGPTGLKDVYGVTVSFNATGDTTVDALVAGTINIANVYSADPRIASNDLVTLEDPEGLFLASNVVPLVNADLADELAEVLNPIDAALTPEGLVALNVLSVDDQESSDVIATKWLTDNGFLS
ncbi:ABC transporter substrate-binding protein [Amnibacterium flavum]|uniref:Glycine/betaine ABC transporter n=1 Tax=Amnibacterium flavum TaxID=2173173 RepID=A0A2V1HNG5_9MICO|nr:ABC transporter substrate-binding protein [Amnibacterium flavum]PVZ94088.1 glycine/betaine ABC transporter [Amnibacterium flavum]